MPGCRSRITSANVSSAASTAARGIGSDRCATPSTPTLGGKRDNLRRFVCLDSCKPMSVPALISFFVVSVCSCYNDANDYRCYEGYRDGDGDQDDPYHDLRSGLARPTVARCSGGHIRQRRGKQGDHRAPRAPTGESAGETSETRLGGQPRHDHRLEGRRRATSGLVPQSPSPPRRHLRRHPHARDGHQRSGRMRQDLGARRPCLRALRDLPPRSSDGIFWEAVTPATCRTGPYRRPESGDPYANRFLFSRSGWTDSRG
jgi:hypothetical protein